MLQNGNRTFGSFSSCFFCSGNPIIQILQNKLIGEIILNYALSIYLFKIGVRHNDSNFISDDLFYTFKHPIYRGCVMYPKEVQKVRDENMSYSTASLDGKSQGEDFILEGKNV